MRLRAFAVAVASLALLIQQAAATPLTLIQDGRGVNAEFCPFALPCEKFASVPSSPFAPFDASFSGTGYSASQSTRITDTEMSGSLSAFSTGVGADFRSNAGSRFAIRFSADRDVKFTLDASGSGGPEYGSAILRMRDLTANRTMLLRPLG